MELTNGKWVSEIAAFWPASSLATLGEIRSQAAPDEKRFAGEEHDREFYDVENRRMRGLQLTLRRSMAIVGTDYGITASFEHLEEASSVEDVSGVSFELHI